MANVLVVDDNPELLVIMTEILLDAGHRVSVAANGKAALSLVGSGGFTLVITDLFMPEKEGLELIVELRRNLPALRVIAMSGDGSAYRHRNNLEMARLLGAIQVLKKPFSAAELVAAVGAALANPA